MLVKVKARLKKNPKYRVDEPISYYGYPQYIQILSDSVIDSEETTNIFKAVDDFISRDVAHDRILNYLNQEGTDNISRSVLLTLEVFYVYTSGTQYYKPHGSIDVVNIKDIKLI